MNLYLFLQLWRPKNENEISVFLCAWYAKEIMKKKKKCVKNVWNVSGMDGQYLMELFYRL